MPHITIEYTANLEPALNPQDLVDAAHAAAVKAGIAKIGGVRTRAERRDVFRVGDGDPRNAFVNVVLFIAPRPVEIKQALGQVIFDAVDSYLSANLPDAPIALSLYIQEIDISVVFRKNKLHERVSA
jgi:5-carboxymethyl-2-hydroxymuconate isomerase